MAGKKVYIVGAGLGGVAFGLSLLKLCEEHSIKPLPEVHLFERDSSEDTQTGHGYSLAVRSDSGGLQVLQQLGVLEDLLPYEEPGKYAGFLTPGFSTLASFSASPCAGREASKLMGAKLRISRATLRTKLLEHFPRSSITYGKACAAVNVLTDGEGPPVRITFQDGSSQACDILVAADGIHSKARASILPLEKPKYTGVMMFAGRSDVMDPLPRPTGEGQWMVPAPTGTFLFVSPLEQHRVHWSVSWQAPLPLAAQLNVKLKDPSTAQEVLDLVTSKAAPFGEPFPTLFRNTAMSGLYATPLMEKLPHPNTAPVICIGDCLHPMTPFSGNGANMAFCDAWQLAQQLMDPSHATLDEAVIAFDAEAGPRSTQALSRGTHLMSLCHQQGIRHWLIRGLICIVRVIMGASSFGDTVKLWRFLGRLFGAHKNAEKL